MSMFKRASRKRVYLKIGITGPAGSGKSYGALKIAEGLAEGGNIAAIDTENGSLSLYDNLVPFDVCDIEAPFEPRKYIDAINTAASAGYKVIVIDSFSHAWRYLLTKKEDLDKRGNGGNRNQFANWGPVKAEMDALKEAILQSPIHVVCCMRSKTEYSQEGGKVQKIGMAAVAEPDVEYEFTTVFDVAMDHKAMVSKDRTGVFGGDAFRIDATTGTKFLRWLDTATIQEVAAPKGKPGEGLSDKERERNAGLYLSRVIGITPQSDEFKQFKAAHGDDWRQVALDAEQAGITTFAALMDYSLDGKLPGDDFDTATEELTEVTA